MESHILAGITIFVLSVMIFWLALKFVVAIASSVAWALTLILSFTFKPRTGLAGVSILDVAKRHEKDVMLFMPSSKRISDHQACCIERGARTSFHRIAAMPNLNLIAKKWADERKNAFFIPLGLKHEMVTAGIVKTASKIKEPEEVYTATSTGGTYKSFTNCLA